MIKLGVPVGRSRTLPGIVLDDTSARLEGEWGHSSNFKPHIGSGYVHDHKKGDGKATATFHVQAPQAGHYQLGMAYSAHETRATRVPIVVSSGPHITTLTVDQTEPLPQGEHFRRIGTVELQADVETTITVVNQNTDGFVILDALQLLPVAK